MKYSAMIAKLSGTTRLPIHLMGKKKKKELYMYMYANSPLTSVMHVIGLF